MRGTNLLAAKTPTVLVHIVLVASPPFWSKRNDRHVLYVLFSASRHLLDARAVLVLGDLFARSTSMTTLSAGMEKLLTELQALPTTCRTKRIAVDRAIALIRAYEEERAIARS